MAQNIEQPTHAGSDLNGGGSAVFPFQDVRRISRDQEVGGRGLFVAKATSKVCLWGVSEFCNAADLAGKARGLSRNGWNGS